MPYLRKLPSGKWQATVRGPDGKKYTKTDPLKGVVKEWAAKEEARMAEGRWRNPRAGKLLFSEWAEKWFAARVVEPETRRGDQGALNNHILPKWKGWRLHDIAPSDVQHWVRSMQQAGVGAQTIRRVYNLFKTLMGNAVSDKLIGESPCQDVRRPATPPKLPAWFTRDQVDRIRAALDAGWGERPHPYRGHSVMVELMVCSGPRWGEAAALCGHERAEGDGNPVDWLRGKARIIGALDQYGKWRSYPKTSRSRREVPLAPHVLKAMGELLADREPNDYVFVTSRGAKPLNGANWRVIWYGALDAANERIRVENRRRAAVEKVPPIPRLDPHDCRHTCASWLVQAGVPILNVQRLLGHEAHSTTMRYAHLAPDRHEPIENAWKTIVAHVWRTEPDAPHQTGT